MIFFEDDVVKVGGVILPGVFKSIEVKSSVLMEEQDLQGNTKKPKQAIGYEDARVLVEIMLMDGETETKEDKLKKIQSLFRKTGQEKPQVYDIVSTHTSIRGVSRVVFKSISTKEKNKKSEIAVNIEFWEYVPIKITASKGKSSGNSSGSRSRSSTSSSNSTKSFNESFSDYLYTRGQAPKLGNKTDATAAADTDITSALTAPVFKLPF